MSSPSTAKRCASASHNCSSHSAPPLVEFVAVDNRLDVFSGRGKIDVLDELFHWYISGAISAPPLDATGAGIVLCQCEWERVGLMFPVFDRTKQIRCTSLPVRLPIATLTMITIGQ